MPQQAELQAVLNAANEDLTVPLNFSVTATPHYAGETVGGQPKFAESPQVHYHLLYVSLHLYVLCNHVFMYVFIYVFIYLFVHSFIHMCVCVYR